VPRSPADGARAQVGPDRPAAMCAEVAVVPGREDVQTK
jgi:hypothetical protein